MEGPAAHGDHARRDLDLTSHYGIVRDYFRKFATAAYSAEDFAQDTYLRAHRAVQARGPPERPVAWLLKIAHDVVVDYFRASERCPPFPPLEPDAYLIADSSVREPPNAVAAEEGERRLLEAIERFPDLDRAVLEARAYDGRGFERFAAELGVPRAALNARFYRARKQLRDALDR